MSQRFELKAENSLNTTVSRAEFHFSVSYGDLEGLRGPERNFGKPKQINRGDPREFIFDISANSPTTDVTSNIYSWMLFSFSSLPVSRPAARLPAEVVSNFGDS